LQRLGKRQQPFYFCFINHKRIDKTIKE